MVGEPPRVWGAVLTYDEATVLRRGEPISPTTSEYDRRDDLVWYFVLEGQVVFSSPGAPGGTPQPDPVAELSLVGMALDAFTGSSRFGSSGPAPRDYGQSQMPIINIPADIYDTPLPTPAPRSTAPAATAAPPATSAPMAPTVTPAPAATAAPKPTSDSLPVFSPDAGPFESALRLVPDKAEHRASIRMNDLNGLRRVFGIEAPGPDADHQDVLEYKISLVLGESPTGGRLWLLGEDWLSGFSFDYVDSAPSTRPFLGFDSRDVDLVMVAGSENEPPPRGLEVIIGNIQSSVAVSLLSECEECMPHEAASHAGIEFYTWGEDARPSLDDRLAAPAHDQFGRGGRILIEDGYSIRTLFTESMQSAIDAISGSKQSLAGNEDFVLAARAADEMGAVSLTLTAQPFRAFDIAEVYGGRGRLTLDGLDSDYAGAFASLNERSGNGDAREALVVDSFVQSGSLPAFEVVGTGLGSDESGVFVTLVLVFKDDRLASDAAIALESRIETGVFPTFSGDTRELTPWNEEIESADIDVTGRTVRVLLRVSDPNHVQQNFIMRSSGAFADDDVGFDTLMMFLIAHD